MAEVCSSVDVQCALQAPAGMLSDPLSSPSTSVFEDFVGWLMRGFLYGVREVLTAWTKDGGPRFGGPDGTLTQVQGNLLWLTMAVMLLGTLVATGKMMLLRDGRPMADFGRSLLITVLVSWGGTALITSLMHFSDRFAGALVTNGRSERFVQQLSGNDLVSQLMGGNGAPGGAATAAAPQAAALFLPLLIGLVAVAAQLGLMYLRIAVLIAIAAMLPLAAAGSATVTGHKWFARLVGWTFAFVVYKPVAAILWVVGIKLMEHEGVTGVVSGIFVLVAAVLAMPALVKLMAPVAASAAGAGASAAATASVAVGAFGASGRSGGTVARTGGTS